MDVVDSIAAESGCVGWLPKSSIRPERNASSTRLYEDEADYRDLAAAEAEDSAPASALPALSGSS